MKESLQKGVAGGERPKQEDPFMTGALEKPVIAAVNGFAMGGGFMLVERTDLRLAVRDKKLSSINCQPRHNQECWQQHRDKNRTHERRSRPHRRTSTDWSPASSAPSAASRRPRHRRRPRCHDRRR